MGRVVALPTGSRFSTRNHSPHRGGGDDDSSTRRANRTDYAFGGKETRGGKRMWGIRGGEISWEMTKSIGRKRNVEENVFALESPIPRVPFVINR